MKLLSALFAIARAWGDRLFPVPNYGERLRGLLRLPGRPFFSLDPAVAF
jgi:hypothetical protein